jgi:hypothetical protein
MTFNFNGLPVELRDHILHIYTCDLVHRYYALSYYDPRLPPNEYTPDPDLTAARRDFCSFALVCKNFYSYLYWRRSVEAGAPTNNSVADRLQGIQIEHFLTFTDLPDYEVKLHEGGLDPIARLIGPFWRNPLGCEKVQVFLETLLFLHQKDQAKLLVHMEDLLHYTRETFYLPDVPVQRAILRSEGVKLNILFQLDPFHPNIPEHEHEQYPLPAGFPNTIGVARFAPTLLQPHYANAFDGIQYFPEPYLDHPITHLMRDIAHPGLGVWWIYWELLEHHEAQQQTWLLWNYNQRKLYYGPTVRIYSFDELAFEM